MTKISDFNEELVGEINSLRTNPKKYAKTISTYIDYFKGKLLCLPGSNTGFQTEEGPDAYKEAADFLLKLSSLDTLQPSKGLCRIAEEFISSVEKPSLSELENKDMEEIINKYGSFSGSFNKAIDLGGETAEQTVINLIVSDGDKTRGQRDAILSTEIKRIGVANGPHKVYRHCSSIVTCSEFENTFDIDDNGLLDEEMIHNIHEKKDGFKQLEKTKENNINQEKELKHKKSEVKKNKKNEEENKGEEKLPKGVASINKTEKIVVENGVKKKITKIIKVMDDGAQQIETTKEVIGEI